MTVGIIDFGMGNLSSVANAFERLECSPILLSEPAQMQTVDRLVLPGVGAFGDGMANLNRGGWIPALEAEVHTGGKPFLGLCLGMQLLATSGTEHGDWQFVQAVYAALGPHYATAEVLNLLNARSDLARLNAHIEQKKLAPGKIAHP